MLEYFVAVFLIICMVFCVYKIRDKNHHKMTRSQVLLEFMRQLDVDKDKK